MFENKFQALFKLYIRIHKPHTLLICFSQKILNNIIKMKGHIHYFHIMTFIVNINKSYQLLSFT